jgi:hypothetical protein
MSSISGRRAGIRCFTVGLRIAYRVTPPWTGKLGSVDHVTIPCRDLRVAEEFYVGLLGTRVALRLDAARLERLGWSPSPPMNCPSAFPTAPN